MNTTWADFILLIQEVRVSNQVSRLLADGWGNLQVLQQLGKVDRVTLSGARLAECYCPWYQTDLGICPWSAPHAEPYSIAAWAEQYHSGGNVPAKEWVEQLVKHPTRISGSGPILLIEDTHLKVSVIAEGNKRACAAYLTGTDMVAIRFRSLYSHALFSSDFLPHILRLRCQQ